MSIDRSAIGRELPSVTFLVDEDRLRLFARAIGETDPIYFSAEAARAAGYPAMPAPPTFTFSIQFEMAEPFGYLTDLGVDLASVLHGSQRFDYRGMAFAGDNLTLRRRIVDIYDRKDGTLEFVVLAGTVVNQHGDLVVDSETVTIVRPGGPR